MSIFVILGLLICIQAPGSSAGTPVFVQTGEDVTLNLMTADAAEKFILVSCNFNEKFLATFFSDGESVISEFFTGRVEFSAKQFSLKLKNLQQADSGVYTAHVRGARGEQTVTEYNIAVQNPVSPVKLKLDSVSNSSDSCNLTVICSTQDSHISSTFRCDAKTCSQEGGERSEVTTSGASLRVYLANDSIVCNHSNQVSWTKDIEMAKQICAQHAGSDGVSVCLVKTVVFSVGLIIMVSAVICVHIMEQLKKQK